jgi:hypothetical protein
MDPEKERSLRSVTAEPLPTSADEPAVDATAPNQYHLRRNGVRISYFPTGAGFLAADDPIIVVYRDSHRALTFRSTQADCVPVPNLGTCVTVTLETTVDAESTTATVLIPTVVLASGQPARIHTELITTMHALNGINHPQRDHYTVTPLRGDARRGVLPL